MKFIYCISPENYDKIYLINYFTNSIQLFFPDLMVIAIMGRARGTLCARPNRPGSCAVRGTRTNIMSLLNGQAFASVKAFSSSIDFFCSFKVSVKTMHTLVVAAAVYSLFFTMPELLMTG